MQNIYQWNGSECNHFERHKAVQLTNYIKNNENAGKGTVKILEEGEAIPEEFNMVEGLFKNNNYPAVIEQSKLVYTIF